MLLILKKKLYKYLFTYNIYIKWKLSSNYKVKNMFGKANHHMFLPSIIGGFKVWKYIFFMATVIICIDAFLKIW